MSVSEEPPVAVLFRPEIGSVTERDAAKLFGRDLGRTVVVATFNLEAIGQTVDVVSPDAARFFGALSSQAVEIRTDGEPTTDPSFYDEVSALIGKSAVIRIAYKDEASAVAGNYPLAMRFEPPKTESPRRKILGIPIPGRPKRGHDTVVFKRPV